MSASSLYMIEEYMATRSLAGPTDLDHAAVQRAVTGVLRKPVASMRTVSRKIHHQTVNVELRDGPEVIVRVHSSTSPLKIESEVATMAYIRTHCPDIPVPSVYYHDAQYLIMEKAPGVQLQTIYDDISLHHKHRIVTQIATWMVELFNHRFDGTGSLYSNGGRNFFVGPMVADPFCGGARGAMDLDRGPWATMKDYFYACAQRELDVSRSLYAWDTSQQYQAMLQKEGRAVERSVELLVEIILRCKCLDEDDPALAPFALHLEDFGPRNLFVDPNEPSRILAVIGWQGTCTRPLWMCAQTPSWISPSLSCAPSDRRYQEAVHLSSLFRRVSGRLNPLFLRALDCDDIRQALEGVVRFDAVQDAFLVLPTLESLVATLPGQEDMDGLSALLDPDTLAGRVARISLVTKGGDALSLADSSPSDMVLKGAGRRVSESGPNGLGLRLM